MGTRAGTGRLRWPGRVGRVAAALSVGVPLLASADDYDLHFVANGSAGATDNVFSAPNGSMTPRDADVQYTLTPGLVAAYGTQRTTHELAASVALNGYASHSEAWGVQLFGDYRAAISVSPFTELSLSAGLSRGTTTALSTSRPSNETQVGPTPSGEVTSLSTRADQALTHALSPETSIRQSLGGSYTIVSAGSGPDVGTAQVSLQAGLDHSFQYSAMGVDIGATFLDFDRGETMSASAEPDRRMDGRLGVRWRRDVSQRWSVGADGGLVAVIPIDGDAGFTPVPVVSASVNYVPEWGTASLQVGRAVSANPFIAQETVSESAGLSANLPLPWLNADRPSDAPEWTASGGLAAVRSRIINSDSGELTNSTLNGLLDVGLAYVPREEMTFAFRFQHTRQKALDGVAGEDGMVSLPSMSRNTLLVTFTYRYPGRIVSQLPPRQVLRVDQDTPLTEREGVRRR